MYNAHEAVHACQQFETADSMCVKWHRLGQYLYRWLPHRISCECLCKATIAGLSVVLFVANVATFECLVKGCYSIWNCAIWVCIRPFLHQMWQTFQRNLTQFTWSSQSPFSSCMSGVDAWYASFISCLTRLAYDSCWPPIFRLLGSFAKNIWSGRRCFFMRKRCPTHLRHLLLM